jgi:membrane protease YdiL (CAAX protease family)
MPLATARGFARPAPRHGADVRLAAALLLLLAAAAVAAPIEAPWANALRPWLERGGWWLPMAVALTLLLGAALLLPRVDDAPTRRDLSAPGLAALLLAEPLLHLGLLAWLGLRTHLDPTDYVLPVPQRLGSSTFWAHALFVLAAAPLIEEFCFRGRLVPLLRARFGAVSAVTLSSLAFACVHGAATQALLALPLGMLLAVLRLAGRDLGACVLVHQAHNALFLFAGPALLGRPAAALALLLGGAALLVLALHGPLRQGWRRALAAGLLIAATALAAQPLLTAVRDRLWARAAHQAVLIGRLNDASLAWRFDAMRARGWLTPTRGALLAQRLAAQPHRRRERVTWAVAVVAPGALTAGAGTLEDLAGFPGRAPAAHDAAARALGLLAPDDFAALASHEPSVLLRWLPLPEHAAAAAAQIAATAMPARKQLLAAFERFQPGQVEHALFRLPPAAVLPIDRYHLQRTRPDWRARAERAGATAFLGPAPTDPSAGP